MADVDVSTISGGGGLPRLSSINPVVAPQGFIRYGGRLASINPDQPLTTMLDVDEPCCISGLFATANQAVATQLDRLVITINGNAYYDELSISIGAFEMLQIIGSLISINSPANAEGYAFLGSSFRCESIKIEASTPASNITPIFLTGNIERIF